MERVFDERIKVHCIDCDHPMLFESNMDNNSSIYLCELCKHEVKIISIGYRVKK